ncbi:hypothetical protein SNE40_020019 [Patella caerulea]|uniref:Endonuclease/exonuclease/phosphatase domain-containing protein n=1 Tax=Patella caerulea TaxID=87958 RepID=A0AAN8G325_PATCE
MTNSVRSSHLIQYTKSQLLQLKDSVPLNVNKRIYKDLKDTDKYILMNKPTRRKTKHRHIKCLITNRNDSVATSVINPKNLIKIKTINKYRSDSANTKMCLLNCRSVMNKTQDINTFICDNDLDILALTEAWLLDSSDSSICELVPTGFSIINVPRHKRGGGVALIHKSSISLSNLTGEKFNSFEYLDSNVSISNNLIRCIIIYRAPSKSEHVFFDEFFNFLENISGTNELLILGDFNFHVDNSLSTSANQFKDLLNNHSFKQHVQVPTHNRGHTLDLVITREGSSLVFDDLDVFDELISDHFPVKFKISIQKPDFETKSITFRKLRNVTSDQIVNELDNTEFFNIHLLSDVNAKAHSYFTILHRTLDNLAPLQTKTIRLRPNSAWFNNDILEAKKLRNKAERKWRETNLTIHEQIFKCKKNTVNYLIRKAKKSYYSDKIETGQNKQKELFRVTNTLLDPNYGVTKLPTTVPVQELPEKFSAYFSQKIVKIREGLVTETSGHVHHKNLSSDVPTLSHFQQVSVSEVAKIIKQSSSKSCSLDPLPTILLKECLPTIVPIMADIINTCICKQTVPDDFKTAIIFPLIKKLGSESGEKLQIGIKPEFHI